MASIPPVLTVLNVSEIAPQWNWLADRFSGPEFRWVHHSRQAQGRWPGPLRGVVAACKAAWQARRSGDALLVAHGPRIGSYTCMLARWLCPKVPVLVFSFNYTHLPQGVRRHLAALTLPHANRYVVFSTLEKTLYSQHLGLPAHRFEFLPWGVRIPADATAAPGERFVCAVGSQGRDYATLFQAMAQLPHIPLVAVVYPDNIRGLSIPANVTVRTAIPLEQAEQILADSQFMVLPLTHGKVPCGHVTVVAAMHRAKAVVCTDSVGLHDYALADHTALLCPPGDAQALAQAIERLWSDPALAQRLGAVAQLFARQHCTEDAVVSWFAGFLQTLPRSAPATHH